MTNFYIKSVAHTYQSPGCYCFLLSLTSHIWRCIFLILSQLNCLLYTILIWYSVFWQRSAYCDAQLPPENLREFLPRLIPVELIVWRIFFSFLWSSFYYGVFGMCFFNIPCHFYRFCCLTWLTLTMMSPLLMLRLSLLGQFVFFSDYELAFVVVDYSFGIISLLQEDGSVPDRDQVQPDCFHC